MNLKSQLLREVHIKSIMMSSCPLLQKIKIVEDEEEAEFSSQSIRIEESLLGVTPSLVAPEVYEISDISSPHMADPEEYIRISIIEENIFFHLCKIL